MLVDPEFSDCYTGNFILSASADRTLILWDTRTGEKYRQLRAHLDVVLASSYNSNGCVYWNNGVNLADLKSYLLFSEVADQATFTLLSCFTSRTQGLLLADRVS